MNSLPGGLQRAVIHYPDRLIKGYVDLSQFQTPDTESIWESGSIALTREGETAPERYSLVNAKAIFIVRNFDGDVRRKDILFHDGSEFLPRIWVKVTFLDGEQIEGFIDNSIDYIRTNGFQLHPSDPTSNNTLIFIIKSQIKNFQVLGLRQ